MLSSTFLKLTIALFTISPALAGMAYIMAGNFFEGLVWLGVGLLGLLIAWPMIAKSDDKVVPVAQIFIGMFIFFFIFSVAFYYDFRTVGFDQAQSLLFCFGAGAFAVGFIMVLNKGN